MTSPAPGSPSFIHCPSIFYSSPSPSPPLTAPQPHRLSVFLQFRNQPVALLDHVRILLVLVVWPVRLYDFVDPVDGAGDAVCGDEFRKVSESENDGISHES